MLAPQVVAEVERLLAEEELPQRLIAKRLGISRSTVALIALGKRRPRPRAGDDEEEDPPPLYPPVRCRGCGGLIEYLPCRLCLARAEREKRRARAKALCKLLQGPPGGC
jgi:hypothetical protein